MAEPAGSAVPVARRHRAGAPPGAVRSGTRHPLVAAAMALPPAVLLVFLFGGWQAVVSQASSVAGMLGR